LAFTGRRLTKISPLRACFTLANADRTYVDPSALRCLYLHDERSRAFCAWRRRLRGSLPITRHGYAELVNAIALAAFRSDVMREVAAGATADLDADLTAGRLRLVSEPRDVAPVTPGVAEDFRARRLHGRVSRFSLVCGRVPASPEESTAQRFSSTFPLSGARSATSAARS